MLDALAAVVEPVILRFYWRPQLKDPNDEMVLETAVNGGPIEGLPSTLSISLWRPGHSGFAPRGQGQSGEKSKGAEHEKK